ncbi:Ras family protein [Acanthocheilonema viteae]
MERKGGELQLDDFRKRNRKTTSEQDFHKCIYFPDMKLSPESRSLANELRECRIINKEEPRSTPRPDFLPDRIFKVVFVGDSAVGKTCFLHRFCHNRFKLLFNATIGVDFTIKTIRLCDRIVAVQLWDTAGQERFRSITKQYFRKADGIILMYDVTSEQSFLNVRNWITSVKVGVDESCVMCLVGNKVDLFANDKDRVLTYKHGKKLAEEFGMMFFETSAFNGFGVNDCMRAVAMKLQECEDQQLENVLKLDMSLQRKQKSWCCI